MKHILIILLLSVISPYASASPLTKANKTELFEYAKSQTISDNNECRLITRQDNFNGIHQGNFGDWKDIILLVYTIGCGEGNYSAGILDIVHIDGGTIKRLSTRQISAGIWDVKLINEKITASTYEYVDGDARCCPSITKRVSYKNSNGKLIPTDLHTIKEQKKKQ